MDKRALSRRLLQLFEPSPHSQLDRASGEEAIETLDRWWTEASAPQRPRVKTTKL